MWSLMDSTERQNVRVGGRAVEWQKRQLDKHRDEKRREVKGETVMTKKRDLR